MTKRDNQHFCRLPPPLHVYETGLISGKSRYFWMAPWIAGQFLNINLTHSKERWIAAYGLSLNCGNEINSNQPLIAPGLGPCM